MTEWDEVDWADLTPRLLGYAMSLLAHRNTPPGTNREQAQKYVLHATFLALSGELEPVIKVRPFRVLAGIIHMEIARDFEKKKPR
jgi:hypothetical protein